MIRIRGLGKRYKLYDRPGQRMAEWLSGGRVRRHREFWALREFDLDVRRGECVGVIGPNGAGKSTLLKILSGALEPSAGSFALDGRVLSLLELGTGLNPQLTGRQNVLQTGMLLGFPQRDLRQRMDAIAEFAELGDFFDRPVRIYSSGMTVRLAFSMFVTLEPDVFIVDEALSVGDAHFRRRCYERLEQMFTRGTTCLFVTHDQGAVTKFCHRGVVMQKGVKAFEGSPRDACNVLNKIYYGEPSVDTRMDYGDGSAEIDAIWFEDEAGQRITYAASRQTVQFCYRVRFRREVEGASCGFHIKTVLGVDVMHGSTDNTEQRLGPYRPGDTIVLRWLIDLDLVAGEYFFGCGCRYPYGQRFMARRVDAVKFVVTDTMVLGGIVNGVRSVRIESVAAAQASEVHGQ